MCLMQELKKIENKLDIWNIWAIMMEEDTKICGRREYMYSSAYSFQLPMKSEGQLFAEKENS